MTDQAKSVEQLQQQVVELRQEIAECRAALQERDLRYRTLLYNLPEKVVHKDRNSVYLSCNKNFAGDFGMTPEQMVGKTDYDLYPQDPELADKYRADDRRIIASGETEEIEERYATPTTTESIVRTLKAAVKDERGDVTGILGIFSDITARKQAEVALQKSEERYRLLMESIPQTVWRADANGEASELNSHWYAYTGQTCEEARGLGWMKALHPDDVERVIERMRAAGARGEVYQAEYRVRRAADGSYRWHLAWGSPMKDKDGNILYWFGSATDIDDRKWVQEALRESEERYRTLAESTRDIIYILDRQGKLLYANHTALACVGLSHADIVGKQQADLFPPEMAKVHLQRIDRVFETGEVFEEDELFHFGPDAVWLRIHLVPLQDHAGQITSVMGVCHNITDRKRAEEALKKAHDELERRVEERTADLVKANEQLAIFRRFAEASEQGFGIADLNGCITYVNPTLCRLMGEQRPEDVVGKQFFDYVAEPSRQLLRSEYTTTMLREGRWTSEGSLLTRQGKVIPIFVSNFLLRDEQSKPAYFATVISDITTRKEAEEALRQSEEKYRGLLEACPDAVIMANLKGKILFASRQVWELAGLSDREELVGKSVFDYVIEDDRQRLAENFSRLLETGVRRQTEYTALRPDGTPVPAEISSAVSRDTKEQPIAVMAVIRDITERKRTENVLRKKHRTLKHLLQSSDHERQLIAYEIHDELAQQLAGAIMQFQTYNHLKETQPKLAGKAYDAGITMLQQGHFEARRLINGVRPPILDEEGIAAAITHLLHEQQLHHRPNIEYRSKVNFDRLAPTLENAIYRIVQEGLANACQHSKSETVRVSLLQQADRLRIEVRDWGIGFDTKAVQGNRYGLEGIRQRARLLGGKCSIRSTAGKGTRIAVELPVVLRD